jgi:hypothetical protein
MGSTPMMSTTILGGVPEPIKGFFYRFLD